jgi:hypothetical protein
MDEPIAKNMKKGQKVTFKDGRGSYQLAFDPAHQSVPDGGSGIYFQLVGLPGFYRCNMFKKSHE